jgi:DNA-binding transcriptional LysR family regulator
MVIKHLYRMAVFAKVVEHGSFSKAATALGLGKSVVSQHIIALEQALGTALINRSPRSFSLTQEGQRFYDACVGMLAQAETAVGALSELRTEAAGTIRMSAPHDLGLSFLIGELTKFSQAHPKVDVDLILDDAISNMIEEGYDVCLRVGWLKETRLYAAKLATFRMVPCASASTMKTREPPRDPADLVELSWVTITALAHPDRLDMQNELGQRRSVRIRPVIHTNTGISAREFVLRGDFAGLLPDYAVREELAQGRLLRLVPAWTTREGSISAVFQHRDRMSPRLRLLLDHLRKAARTHYGA